MKRRLRTKLSLIVKLNLAQAVENKQKKQKTYKHLKCKRDRPVEEMTGFPYGNTRANSKTDNYILGNLTL